MMEVSGQGFQNVPDKIPERFFHENLDFGQYWLISKSK